MINFYKERGFEELFQDTIIFFKSEIKTITKLLLVFVAPFSLYSVYFMFKFQDILQAEILKSFKSQDFSNIPNELYIFLGFSVLQQLLTVLSISAFIKLKVFEKEINTSNILKVIFSSFTNVFAGQIFIFLAIFSTLLLVALFGFNSFTIMFVIIWSIYILVSMYLLSFIIIFENQTLIHSIKRSFQLIKGRWWFTFGTIVVFGIIIGLSEMTISAIITSIIGLISKSDFAAIIVLLTSAFISLVLSAVSIIVSAFLYFLFVKKTNTKIDNYYL